MRSRIDLNCTTMDLLLVMAEGNPGACLALAKMAKTEPRGLVAILHLDEMNIRGAQVWIAFKDHCEGDVNKLIDAAINHEQSLVDTVNACPGNGGEVASVGAPYAHR